MSFTTIAPSAALPTFACGGHALAGARLTTRDVTGERMRAMQRGMVVTHPGSLADDLGHRPQREDTDTIWTRARWCSGNGHA